MSKRISKSDEPQINTACEMADFLIAQQKKATMLRINNTLSAWAKL